MAKLKSGTRIYGTATVDTSVVVGSAVTLTSSGVQVVGIVTATSFSGSGSNLTGIVTSIVAGTNVTISGSTGQVTINAAGGSGGAGSNFWAQTGAGIHTLSNVGIGTTNPISALTVTGNALITGIATANSFRARGGAPGSLGANNNGYGFFGSGDNDSGMYSSADGQIEFYNNNNESARITSNRNLLIGRTSVTGTASQLLQVESGAYFAGDVGIGTTNPANGITHLDIVRSGANIQVRNTSTTGQASVFASDADYFTSFRSVYISKLGTAFAGNVFGSIPNADLGFLAFQNTTNALIYTNGGSPIIFGTVSTEAMRIDPSQRVGIGTNNPTSKLHVVGDAYVSGVVTATSFFGSGANLTGLVPNTVTASSASTPQFIGFLTTSSGVTSSILASSTLTYIPSSGNLGIGTNNPSHTLHVQGNARITGAFRDSTNSPGTSGQILQSTVSGTTWVTASSIPAGGRFDTSIDNVLYVQPTGTLDIVGVGTTTTQITTLPSSSPEYIIHSMHVTNISNGDAEITAGFVMNARKVPATISVSIGQSGGPGIHTITVGSASSITVGMAVTGTGNIGETTGLGATAGFQYNTYVTSVDSNMITLSKPMSGYATGTLFFSPVSDVVSRLPVPVGSAVELLKQPMVLNALDSIVLQSTGAGSGIGLTSTLAISQTLNSNFLTVTAGAAITNFLASGMLIQGTGTNTGIQTNTFVGVGYTPGALSIPMTRPATSTLSSQSLSFTEVVTPQDGALQTTIVYQSTTDTSYQNGTGTVVAISSNTTSVTAGLSTIPVAYYSTGTLYPSVVQSIRVSNISDGTIYPGGDYPVSVGIGNSDTIFSWLAYNMIIPRNSSIELCEAPKRIGIGQSIFAFSNTPNAIEIQIAGKQRI